MPQQMTIECPHELRPGITVCLHCLHATRLATAGRRRKAAKHVALALVAVLVLASAGGTGLQFFNGRDAGARPTRPRVSPPVAAAAQPAPGNDTPVQMQPVASVEVVQTPPKSALSPVVAEGPTELSDGMRAARKGDTVTVHFDMPMLRTRRPEKFESIVRSTLAVVYGPGADSLLATIPVGTLVHVEDLFAELPTSGLHIAIPSGGKIAIWPETRERADGPLVVAYRTTVTR